ncbi:MAG: ATP-binding protein [Anaerolineae bacterium]|nr:ATP-binding protein [Anaerolineae bacterium]
MSTPLASHLQQLRQRSFVGREGERGLFSAALHAETLPFNVLHLHGPGGVGKTTLMKEWGKQCGEANALALYLDARNIDPSPLGFCLALNAGLMQLLGKEPASSPNPAAVPRACSAALVEFSALNQCGVLFIDTYELLKPLDSWLYEEFVPQMPDTVLLVLAGRHSPSAMWRDDPAWGVFFRAVPLRNLSADESKAYLLQRRVPENQYSHILQFTHGHPLALSLVADTVAQRSETGAFQPADNPDVIKTLLERFVQKVPSPAHRAALEACGMVRLLTEGILSRMLNMPDVSELFDWLRSLSFIEAGRMGLFPHDLAREAIVTDVHWRNPDWYAELHKRAREYYNVRLNSAPAAEHDHILLDMVFLHRDNAVVRQTFDWAESGTIRSEIAQPSQFEAMIAMTRQFEGEASARHLAHWLALQPQRVYAFRQGNQLLGFMSYLALDEADESEIKPDPIAWNGWQHIRKHAPLRSGERALMFRHWMAVETYQQVSPVQSLVFVRAVQHYLTTQKLAYTIFVCAYPDLWEGVLTYADLERLRAGEVQMDGKPFGLYGHDWRVVGVPAWFQLLAEREMAYNPIAARAEPKPSTELVALSEDDFADALRDVLKQMSRSLPPRGNPLLNSKLVIDQFSNKGGGATHTASELERAAMLRNLVAETAKTLEASPRDVKLYRAFYHTYVKPAPSQEAASELIDVPFSSYRRHLQTAVDRVTDLLWAKEIGL